MPKTKDGGFLLDDSDLEHVKIVVPKPKELVKLKARVQAAKAMLKGKRRG